MYSITVGGEQICNHGIQSQEFYLKSTGTWYVKESIKKDMAQVLFLIVREASSYCGSLSAQAMEDNTSTWLQYTYPKKVVTCHSFLV